MKLKTLLLPILFLCIFIFLTFHRVSAVECNVEAATCPTDLLEKIATIKGASFFFGNFEKKLQADQSTNSIYILQSITKKFPATIVLSFQQEQIKYAILLNDVPQFIGESGIVIPNQTAPSEITNFQWNSTTPVIENNKVAQKYHSLFLLISETMAQTTIKNPIVVWNSDSEIILKLENQPPLIFDEQTIETQIKKVDTIISARELDEIEEPILEIDMRFNLPVLRTRQ